MSTLFGPLADKIQVGHLLRMESGIADFEGVQPFTFDYDLLKDGDKEHSPLEIFEFIGSLPEKDGCQTANCTFLFEPGTAVAYSSTGYMLAGMVLVGATPQPDFPLTWQTLDIFKTLGLTKEMYPNTFFSPVGSSDEKGLTVVGDDGVFGADVPIYKQNCSIMGWTAGFCTTNAHGIAQFYWDLFYKKNLVS